jgi:putative membrane protein
MPAARNPIAVRQVNLAAAWPLFLGLLVLAALWLGPLPAISRHAFSWHMILHLGVSLVAAPLIAIGTIRCGGGLGEPRHPVLLGCTTSLIEMIVVWGWHAPLPHEAAALDERMFAAQQLSFLLAGAIVWGVAFSGSSRGAAGAGALTLLLTFTHMVMLGMLLVLTPHLIYSPAVCQGSFGLGPLEDQHLGGALMAVGGGLPYLIGGTVLLYRMIAD